MALLLLLHDFVDVWIFCSVSFGEQNEPWFVAVWSLLLLLVALWICCCVTLLLHGFVALLVDVWIFCCVSFVVSSVPFLVTTLCCAGVWGYDYQHMIFVFSPALFVSFFPALFVSFLSTNSDSFFVNFASSCFGFG